MPTTPTYALPYPAPSDPADVPADLAELALALDAKALARPLLVTALPGSPVNGQEVYFQSAAMAALGIVWHLRYRSAAPGSYKWEYIGGSPLRHSVPAAEPRGSGSVWGDVATIGPTITPPLAGEFECLATCGAYEIPTTGYSWSIGIALGAANPVPGDDTAVAGAGTGAFTASWNMILHKFKTLAAGQEYRLRYRVESVGCTYVQRVMTFTPIWVG